MRKELLTNNQLVNKLCVKVCLRISYYLFGNATFVTSFLQQVYNNFTTRKVN